MFTDTAAHDVGKRIGDPKGRANTHRKQGAGKTGHGIAQQHDSRQHKTGVDGTHECHGNIGYAGTRRPDIPNAHSEHQGKKQGIQQHRIAQRRQRKEHGGSDTHALVSHLAIEPCHTEKLIAAQTAHDGNKDGRGHDTQNQAQDKDNGVDDTGGGTGNKARQPRTGAASSLQAFPQWQLCAQASWEQMPWDDRTRLSLLGLAQSTKPTVTALIGQNGVDKGPNDQSRANRYR